MLTVTFCQDVICHQFSENEPSQIDTYQTQIASFSDRQSWWYWRLLLIIPRRGVDTTSGRWIQSIGAALRPVFVFEDPMIYACSSGRKSQIRSGRSGSDVSSESVCPHVGLKEAATSRWFGHSDTRSADAVLGSEVYLSAAVHASISETRWRHAGARDQPGSVAKYLNVGCYHQPFRGRPGRGVQRSGSP
jgi:hypothetical protein